MTRIPTPADIEAAPAASQSLLAQVKQQLGVVPNLFRLIGQSPAALEGYLALSGALAKGALDPATRERIALAIAEVNRCGYCLSAHVYLGKAIAKLSDEEIAANRAGVSTDARAHAAVAFAVKVARQRGQVNDDDLDLLRAAGYAPAEQIEIIVHVALNTLTNYVNEVARTEIDFPKVAFDSAA